MRNADNQNAENVSARYYSSNMSTRASRALQAEAIKEIRKAHLEEALAYNHPDTTLKSIRIPNKLMGQAKTYMNQHGISFSQLIFKALNNEIRRR